MRIDVCFIITLRNAARVFPTFYFFFVSKSCRRSILAPDPDVRLQDENLCPPWSHDRRRPADNGRARVRSRRLIATRDTHGERMSGSQSKKFSDNIRFPGMREFFFKSSEHTCTAGAVETHTLFTGWETLSQEMGPEAASLLGTGSNRCQVNHCSSANRYLYQPTHGHPARTAYFGRRVVS